MKTKIALLVGLVWAAGGDALASSQLSIGVRIGAPPPVIIRQAPPRRVSDAVVVSPGPGYVWVAGHYSWQNGQWIWISGAWVNPPQPGVVWVEGRWDAPTNSWTEGHWELVQPTSPPPAVPTTPPPAPPVEVIVREAPPPIRIERHGRRPGRDYVWVNGYWIYRSGHYHWVPGRWELPPRGHRVWIAPRWEHRRGTHIFIEGHWN